jgi:tetratricopeptide (TPR) repeat protein
MRGFFTRTAVILIAGVPLLVAGAGAREQVTAPDAHARASSVALVVFQNLPGGAAILSGDYQRGLDESLRAAARSPHRHPMEFATNICAARVKLGLLEAANESCESALARPPTGSNWSLNQYRAVAHVNHGVVHLVQGDREIAVQEFSRARRLYPSLGVASSNRSLAEDMVQKPQVIVGEPL